MARTPKLTTDIPSHVTRAEKVGRREREEKQAREALEGKVFADLTPAEKDDLLKRLAIRAGLVEE